MVPSGWLETCVEVDFCANRVVEKKAAAAVGHRLAIFTDARSSPPDNPPSRVLR
jgi:hypothetical protein